jgi:hypothetical protein
MRDLDDLFLAMKKSRFRSRFRLSINEQRYLQEKTLPLILQHAQEFLLERIASERPKNDGKQTPMRGHPIFVAQHATATCCRRCLNKWHFIAQGTALNDEQIDYIVTILKRWLVAQDIELTNRELRPQQRMLFEKPQ